ncbi:MAG: DUF2268 domain-containing putative Zn-dependent protease [Alphaproteobacteria bacterium]
MSVIFDTRFPVYQFPDQHPCITTVIAHEWHHVVRELGVGYGKTLGQHLVSEGLAQAFEAQVMNDVPPIALALAKKRLRAFEDPIKGMLLKRDFQGFPEIFVGERGGTYPKWFGYSFGYHLVNEWLTQNGITASGAVNINAGKIIKPWRDGTISPFKNMSDLKSAHL